ncbi:MAG: hypothetical protein IRZ16_01660 [Myxococcaceae bacterium]|nr:hypothetical protein [Myxococcaceae bacterium]
MDRRQVLGRLGALLLVLPVGRVLAGCGPAAGSQGPTDAGADPSGLAGGADAGRFFTFTSNVANGHTHDIALPASALETLPVPGFTGPTSVVQGHSHTLRVTQDDLQALASGGTRVIETSLDAGHTHTFELRAP